jgi:hypothetical protein
MDVGGDRMREPNLKATVSITLIISAIMQIIAAIIYYVLGGIALMIRYDVIYWPPFLVFSLDRMLFWQTIAITALILSVFQIIIAVVYRFTRDSPKIDLLIKILAGFTCIFFPVGTFCGIYVFLLIKKQNAEENQEDREVGKIFAWTGLVHAAFVMLLYLLTLYFATVMLDLTFPYLTMGVLLTVRLYLGILWILCGLQIGLGICYPKLKKNALMKIIYGIAAVMQLPIIPFGSMAGMTLLRDLKKKPEIMES